MKHIYIYTAGLFDGEGSVMLLKSYKSKFRVPTVSITSTSKSIIDFLTKNFGGIVCNQKVYKSHHKQSWSWRINYDAALNFLSKIYPYLIEEEKVRRTKLLLEQYKQVTVRNGKYSPELLAKKKAFEVEFYS